MLSIHRLLLLYLLLCQLLYLLLYQRLLSYSCLSDTLLSSD